MHKQAKNQFTLQWQSPAILSALWNVGCRSECCNFSRLQLFWNTTRSSWRANVAGSKLARRVNMLCFVQKKLVWLTSTAFCPAHCALLLGRRFVVTLHCSSAVTTCVFALVSSIFSLSSHEMTCSHSFIVHCVHIHWVSSHERAYAIP